MAIETSECTSSLLLACYLLKTTLSSRRWLRKTERYFLLLAGLKDSSTLVRALNLRLKYLQYSSHLGLLSFRFSGQSCSLPSLPKF